MTVFCVISPIGIGVGLVLKEESVLETFVSFLEKYFDICMTILGDGGCGPPHIPRHCNRQPPLCRLLRDPGEGTGEGG